MKKLYLLFLFTFAYLSDIRASNPDSEEVQNSGDAVPSPEAQTTSDAQLVAGVINDFAFKLLKLMNPKDNYAISPVSVFLALAMTYLGSGGTTKRQLENALGLDSHDLHGMRLHEDLSELISKLPPKTTDFKLKAANAMIVDRNFNIKREFVETLRKLYYVMFSEMNFKDGNSVVNQVNNWVAQHTENTISKVLERAPSPDAGIVLLNAVYFSGTWQTQFPKNTTQDRAFTLTDGTTIKVPFMSLPKMRLKYFEDLILNHTFVRLPYKGNQISMIIALSDELGTPEIEMSHDLLCRIRSAMREIEIEFLSIPKFQIEFTRQLNDPMISLGASDMFSPKIANFSGMREGGGLSVSSINHKVVLQVDETGSVAAAVTTVSLVRLSLARKVRFIADKPFTFFIIDERSGLVLFRGKVVNPSIQNTDNASRRNTGIPPRRNPTMPTGTNTAIPPRRNIVNQSTRNTINSSTSKSIRVPTPHNSVPVQRSQRRPTPTTTVLNRPRCLLYITSYLLHRICL